MDETSQSYKKPLIINLKPLLLILAVLVIIILSLGILDYFKIVSVSPFSSFNHKLQQNIAKITAPKPGSCKILPEKFCPKAEQVMVKGIRAEFTYLGFKNLPAGTPIFSPLDGFFTVGNESGPQFVGSNIGISIPNVKEAKGGIIIRGIIRIDNTTQRDIRSGEIIGYKKDGKTLDGKYDLLFTITKATASGAETDEDILRKLFPKAFETGAKKISP